jgi:hypothetical protein
MVAACTVLFLACAGNPRHSEAANKARGKKQENLDAFEEALSKAGIDGSVVREVKVPAGDGLTVEVTVTRAWSLLPKMDQEEAAKRLWALWAATLGPDAAEFAELKVYDEDNNYLDTVRHK